MLRNISRLLVIMEGVRGVGACSIHYRCAVCQSETRCMHAGLLPSIIPAYEVYLWLGSYPCRSNNVVYLGLLFCFLNLNYI